MFFQLVDLPTVVFLISAVIVFMNSFLNPIFCIFAALDVLSVGGSANSSLSDVSCYCFYEQLFKPNILNVLSIGCYG
jgi:hypothetical protein